MPQPRSARPRRPGATHRHAVAMLAFVGLLASCGERPRDPLAPAAPPAAARTPAEPAPPIALEGPCQEGELPSGALWRICPPVWWNGSLAVYAPGYASIYEPLRIRDDDLGGFSVQEMATGLGFVYATTSYHKGGLVLPQATTDLAALVQIARAVVQGLAGRDFQHVYLVGPSLGGLVTARSVEDAPHLFSGGLAACGPYGRFRSQVDYTGDFRAVFDYLFASRVQGWPVWRQRLVFGDPGRIDEGFRASWTEVFEPRVRAALLAHPGRAAELIQVTRAPIDGGDVAGSTAQTVTGVLWYHIFGTNDVLAVLGGQPFDNRHRVYFGSGNDLLLNLRIQRFSSTGPALSRISAWYETSGALQRPLVTLHTTGDEIVPFWHQLLYLAKASGSHQHVPVPVVRYGHCNFTLAEVLAAFAILVLRASGQQLEVPATMLPEREAQQRMLELAGEHGAAPVLVEERAPRGR